VKVGGVALILSALALGLALLALTRKSESPSSPRAPVRTDRVGDLERRVADLADEVEALKTGRPVGTRAGDFALPSLTGGENAGGQTDNAPRDAETEALKALVDVAVDRKAAQVMEDLRVKADKKPSIGVFASTLDLTPEQRAAAERVIVEGQREIHRILNLPTASGANPMDELVEIFARGIAEPGKDHGFGRWVSRYLTEKIPGTDETYAARTEAVKNEVRASFKRDWSEAQYREFQEWGLDPTEIKDVPGSPNEALFRERIVPRLKELGAEVPGGR